MFKVGICMEGKFLFPSVYVNVEFEIKVLGQWYWSLQARPGSPGWASKDFKIMLLSDNKGSYCIYGGVTDAFKQMLDLEPTCIPSLFKAQYFNTCLNKAWDSTWVKSTRCHLKFCSAFIHISMAPSNQSVKITLHFEQGSYFNRNIQIKKKVGTDHLDPGFLSQLAWVF